MDNQLKKQLQSFMLPASTTIIIPGIILYLTWDMKSLWGLNILNFFIQFITGFSSLIAGLYLLVSTISMFIKIGNGTLAPWAPAKHLVVQGMYLHTRNPMISGVLLVLLGESILFGSLIIFIWFILFFTGNAFYFIYSEEPGLEKRFGKEYLKYKKNVPRWIPRLSPWEKEQ